MTSKNTGPCPSCIFIEQYNRDGSFAAFMDYQNDRAQFMGVLGRVVETLLTDNFNHGVGIRISKRHTKAYIKTGLGLLGFPDVASIMDSDAVHAQELLQERLEALVNLRPTELDCEEGSDDAIVCALSRWKEHASELYRHTPRTRKVVQLVR